MSRKLLSLAVVFLLPVLFAAPALAIMAGPHIYYVKPQDIDGTIGFGVQADLYQFSPALHLDGNVDYWSKSMDSVFGSSLKFHDLSFGGTLKYFLGQPGASVQPYGLAGLGLHLFHAEVALPEFSYGGYTVGGGTASDNSSKIGIDIGGGAQFGSSEKMKFFGELRYRIVSDVGQLCIGAGVNFPF